MKKVFKILLAQVLLLVCCVQAFAENYDDFFYVQGYWYGFDIEYYINVYEEKKSELIGDIVIPSELKNDEGTVVSVQGIAIGAFENCSGITSIMIPNTVAEISYNAFANCTGLTSIEIPESVTNVHSSFSGCSNLSSVTLKVLQRRFIGVHLPIVRFPRFIRLRIGEIWGIVIYTLKKTEYNIKCSMEKKFRSPKVIIQEQLR